MAKNYELVSDYSPAGDQPTAIKSLIEGIEDGLTNQVLLGVTGSGKTYTMANIIAKLGRPAIIMAPNKTLAAQLYGEMKAFFPNNAVEYFVSYYDYYQPEAYVPASDTFIDKDASINDHIEQMRLSATRSILERRDSIIVASVSAIYGLGDPSNYHGMVFHLKAGDKIDQRDILRRLTELQYTRNDMDLVRATYRVRGEVIDVVPAESDLDAIRLELFDDELESIRRFDPLTGEIKQTLSRVTIYPKTHYVTSRQTVLDAIETIKAELKIREAEFRDNHRLIEAQRIRERTMYDIEMMQELGYCSGIENYSRHLTKLNPGDAPPCLLNYLPDDALMFIDESHVTVPQIGGMYKGDRARKTTLVEYGFRLPSAMDNRPLCFEEFEKITPQTIHISATPGDYEIEHAGNVAEQIVRPTGLVDPTVTIRPVASQVDDLLSEINKRVGTPDNLGDRVLVTTLTKRMAEQLTEYLTEHNVRVRYLHSDIDTVERMEIIRDLRLGVFDVLVGINLLREGLDMPEVSLVAILDADKEGFLRGERALIQTIGRAARNVKGEAILYADKMTRSMQKAIDETSRRREKQLAFNKEHGITPKGIQKAVRDIMDTHLGESAKVKSNKAKDKRLHLTDPKTIAKEIKALEQEMHRLADDLEFEKAAALRDKVKLLREQFKG